MNLRVGYKVFRELRNDFCYSFPVHLLKKSLFITTYSEIFGIVRNFVVFRSKQRFPENCPSSLKSTPIEEYLKSSICITIFVVAPFKTSILGGKVTVAHLKIANGKFPAILTYSFQILSFLIPRYFRV